MLNKTKILLVEDEDLIRELLSDTMEADGYTVIATANGGEAIALLQAGERFDLLMTDLQLAGTHGGFDVARTARDLLPDMPLIFTTGQPDRMSSWNIGPADAFIAKPFRPSEIRAAVRRMISASD